MTKLTLTETVVMARIRARHRDTHEHRHDARLPRGGNVRNGRTKP